MLCSADGAPQQLFDALMNINTIRKLSNGDRERLEAFLAPFSESSMFLLSNSRRGGLEYDGKPLQGSYFGALSRNAIRGVISQSWNGHVVVQAPFGLEPLCKALHADARISGRPLLGVNGPTEQVRLALRFLGIEKAAKRLDSDEGLYSLVLRDVEIPLLLRRQDVRLRPPHDEDRQLLVDWQIGYAREALGARDTSETRREAEKWTDAVLAGRGARTRILEVGGVPVSRTCVTASLPDIVQIGGVWTPPPLRNLGYARAAVAADLAEVAAEGVEKAVLFTRNPAAAHSYEAVGFRQVGHYSLVMLAQPFLPSD